MATVDVGARRRGGGLFAPEVRATTAGVVLVITLVAFEAMAVATAMPTAVRELDGLAYYGWPFTVFLVASVVGTVTSGEVCDRRGPRLPMLAGTGVFAAGLVAAGAAPDMLLFVLARGVQGLGGGLVVVALYVVVAEAYPESLRPRVFSLTSAAWVMPSLVGPPAAGALTQYLTWRLVFLGLAPLVVLGLVLLWSALCRLPDHTPAEGAAVPRRRSMVPFALLAAVGFAALQYAGQSVRPASLLPLAAGLLALVHALRRLLPAGTVRARRGLPASIAVRGLMAGAFFGVDSFVPLTLTELHGYSPSAAGLPLMVAALGWSAGSWLQSRWTSVPGHRKVLVGFVLIAASAAALVAVTVRGVPGWLAAPLWTVAGAGMGLAMATASVLMLELSPKEERGQNSAALQICDMLGSAACVGLGGVLLATLAGTNGATPGSIALVDLLMAAVAVVGVVVAGRVRRPEAAGTADAAEATEVAGRPSGRGAGKAAR